VSADPDGFSAAPRSGESAHSGALKAAPADGRKLRVLLAEDNPVNQRLAARLLEKRGHTVEMAGNGKEAVAARQKTDFALILLDIQMPERNGFEATAAIRQQERAAAGDRVRRIAFRQALNCFLRPDLSPLLMQVRGPR
jgi:PleD family two-component response regulator